MVDHDFLFGLNFVYIRWVSLLYKDATSIVTVNGLTSGPFPVRRGVRQGCPLSPLYVLFSETLNTSLDRCFGFRPFNVPGGARVKCVQYADDVTCIASDLASFKPLMEGFDHLPRGYWCQTEQVQEQRAAIWRYWGGFLFRHHWPGSFSNNRPKATRPSGVYTQIGDSLRRIKEEGGPHVLLNVAPSVLYPHCFVQCSRLCARRLAGPPSLQMCGGLCVGSAVVFAAVIRRHIWNSRCRLVFDGDVWRAEDVVPLVQSDIRLRMRRTMHGFPTLPFVDAGASLSSTIGTAFPG
ncbi:pol-like protein [Apostichopus japonicus]|uniref:Pol-like protein n=1 Tax=Stichopus japonicus TaxID=307972 RepID=A0A2G8KEP0_STIJA|nr:pol-like protein [Apostichopus japonicus]